jgi:excisionase family DNA binding protein
MAKRRPNSRRVKTHRSYSVEEIASLLGAHKNTVRAWVKAGLPTIDGKRPMLISGADLADFLKARRAKNKQPCKPGELYCVRCRLPRIPAGGMADCWPVTETIGHLQAICPDRYCMMNRRVNMSKLGQVRGILAITFTKALKQPSRLWAYRGKVTSAKLGSRLMIPTSELDRIIAENLRSALENPQSAPALPEERLADVQR